MLSSPHYALSPYQTNENSWGELLRAVVRSDVIEQSILMPFWIELFGHHPHPEFDWSLDQPRLQVHPVSLPSLRLHFLPPLLHHRRQAEAHPADLEDSLKQQRAMIRRLCVTARRAMWA